MRAAAEPIANSKAASLRGQVSPEEWQTRIDLAAAHRFAALKGWQDDHMVYNHFSARIPNEPGHFLMKPHDMLFREVTASNLRKIAIAGPELGFEHNINAAGFAIHGGVLEARLDLNAVMHLHSVAGTALGVLERGLMCITQESMQFYNRIGYHDFEGVAEVEERASIVRDLGPHKALILRNHGLLTGGRTIGEAVKKLYHLVRIAEIQLAALATGQKIVEPSPEICERTAQMFEGRPASAGDSDWGAIIRWLNFHDTSYAD